MRVLALAAAAVRLDGLGCVEKEEPPRSPVRGVSTLAGLAERRWVGEEDLPPTKPVRPALLELQPDPWTVDGAVAWMRSRLGRLFRCPAGGCAPEPGRERGGSSNLFTACLGDGCLGRERRDLLAPGNAAMERSPALPACTAALCDPATHLVIGGTCAGAVCKHNDPGCCAPKCVRHAKREQQGKKCGGWGHGGEPQYVTRNESKPMAGTQGTAYRVLQKGTGIERVVKLPNPVSGVETQTRAWKANNEDLAEEFCFMQEIARCTAGRSENVMAALESGPCLDNKIAASGSYVTESMVGDLQRWGDETSNSGVAACAKAVAKTVYAGLECVHSAGFAHGDLKKDNVLYRLPESQGCPAAAIADFGLSARLGEETSQYSWDYASGSYHLPLFLFGSRRYKIETKADWCSFVYMIRLQFRWTDYAQHPPSPATGHTSREIDCDLMGPGRTAGRGTRVTYWTAGAEDGYAPVLP